MLTRIRIEVEGEDSASTAEEALKLYVHALMVAEAERYGLKGSARGWSADDFGPEVTDEVIEYVPDHPGYRARRVVKFTRIDTRSSGPAPAYPASARA